MLFSCYFFASCFLHSLFTFIYILIVFFQMFPNKCHTDKKPTKATTFTVLKLGSVQSVIIRKMRLRSSTSGTSLPLPLFQISLEKTLLQKTDFDALIKLYQITFSCLHFRVMEAVENEYFSPTLFCQVLRCNSVPRYYPY